MLEITPQRAADPAASIELDESMISATSIQKRLFQPDHTDLPGRLLRAAHGLADQTAEQSSVLGKLINQYNVTAADGAYARMVWAAVSFGGEAPMDLIQTTRQLGSGAFGYEDSLEHVRTGPISLLESAIEAGVIEAPTVELKLSQEFLTAKSTQRKRLISHLDRLSPGVDLRITGSWPQRRKFLELHSDILPDAVNERAHESKLVPSSISADRAERAEDALTDLGLDHDALEIVEMIVRTRARRLSYSRLYEIYDGEIGKSTVRKRISRLRDHDLVETRRVNGEQTVSILPVGEAAVEKHPRLSADADDSTDAVGCGPSQDAVGPMRPSADSKLQDGSDTDHAVQNPRNPSDSTVYSNTRTSGGEVSRASATAGGSGPSPGQPSEPKCSFMSYADHHAVAAAGQNQDIAFLDRKVSPDQDRRQVEYSYDEDRDEVVTSVNASPNIAITAVRMCAALFSDPALNQVLTRSRVAGGVDKDGFAGLCADNIHVLSKGPQLGWLSEDFGTASRYLSRLEGVRRELLSRTTDLKDENGYDSDACRDLLEDALGFRGVVLQLYQQLGVDVVEEISLPDGADTDLIEDLREFTGSLTSIGASYQIHSAHRVLHEPRPEKRESMFEPDIDLSDPQGELHSSIVISADNASEIMPEFKDVDADLELQEDENNFAAFEVPMTIDTANGRDTIAIAATRCIRDLNMRPTREAISMIAALCGNVVDVTTALRRLRQEDEETEIDCKDIRAALSMLDSDRILPGMGGSTVSAVVSALTDATDVLTTKELAEIADCSTRSIQQNQDFFDLLEAAGLIVRTEQGDGKATVWRLNLAFSEERHNENQPLPDVLDSGVQLPNQVADVLLEAIDEHGLSLDVEVHTGTAETAFYGPLQERDLIPWIREHYRLHGLIRLLAMLLDQTHWLDRESLSVRLGKQPQQLQQDLEQSVSAVAD